MSALICIVTQQVGVLYSDHGTSNGCNPGPDCQEAKIASIGTANPSSFAAAICGHLKGNIQDPYLLQQLMGPIDDGSQSIDGVQTYILDFLKKAAQNNLPPIFFRCIVYNNDMVESVCYDTDGSDVNECRSQETVGGAKLFLGGCLFSPSQPNHDNALKIFRENDDWDEQGLKDCVSRIMVNTVPVNCCHVSSSHSVLVVRG